MKQGLFEVFGDGELGLKADDLNRYAEIITASGMSIPEGIVIATGVFDQFMRYFILSEENETEEIYRFWCPDFMLFLNQTILDGMTVGIPYAIRSSALSERGGTGIYHSTFFVKTGNNTIDLPCLWEKERAVYASEFTDDARAWRQKMELPIGMAILIQPVCGKRYFDGNFAPCYSGTAYTSYEGEPFARLVAGLGTSAVAGHGQTFDDHFDRSDIYFDRITTIDEDGHFSETVGDIDEFELSSWDASSALRSLFDKMEQIRQNGDLYLEWAYDGETIWIVQCAPHQDKTYEPLPEIDTTGMNILAEGRDFVGHGQTTCEELVVVRLWCEEAVNFLEEIVNPKYHNYLLLIPSQAIGKTVDCMPANGIMLLAGLENDTRIVDLSLRYSYFSNAGAILERQQKRDEFLYSMMPERYFYEPDHTDGKGGTHFQGICDRTDVLFLGTILNGEIISGLIPAKKLGKFVTIYKVQTKVIIDSAKRGGKVYLAEQKPQADSRYSEDMLEKWCMTLRYAANDMPSDDVAKEYTKEPDLVECFYCVYYAIDPDRPGDFDPFGLEPTILARFGMTKIIHSLGVVIRWGDTFVDEEAWQGGLGGYLQDLRDHLVAAQPK